MITAIIIYVVLSVFTAYRLRDLYTSEETTYISGDYIIRPIDKLDIMQKYIGIYGVIFILLLFLPILLLTKFYYWNFIEPEQYGTKQ